MRKKVLILGGGALQIPLIKKVKEKGHLVYLSDYYENPPGKGHVDGSKRISTFSVEDNLLYARQLGVDHILTIGTDQPVHTAAAVSERLGLGYPITEELAIHCTNKSYMKKKMVDNNIPTPAFAVGYELGDFNLKNFRYPVVMKPVDSQGQRGIFVLEGAESAQDLLGMFEESKKCSITGQVIFEEFYSGKEITVNAWVKGGQAYILMNTDRLHYDDSVALGICKQQRYPAQYAASYEEEIREATQKLVEAFGINEGPLYIQMVVGKEGAKFVEFGYRIGGGFESEIIPRVTGVDILELYVSLVIEGKNYFDTAQLQQKARIGSIFFLFNKPGIVKSIKLPADFFENHGRLYIKEGDSLGRVSNATSRIGCFDFYTNDPEEYYKFLTRFDAELALLDDRGEDLLIHNLWE